MTEINEIHRCNAEAFGGGTVGQERQEKLYNAKIAVVGSGILGQSVLAGLYGLGINNIYFFDDAEQATASDNWFLHEQRKSIRGEQKNVLIKESLDLLNPEANLIARHGRFTDAFLQAYKPNIIIDATNSTSSKQSVIDYATAFKFKNIPVLSLSSDKEKGRLTCYWPKTFDHFTLSNKQLDTLVHEAYEGTTQGGFTSGVIAGLALEEVRKQLFRYDEQDRSLLSKKSFTYNINSSRRTGEQDLDSPPLQFYRHKKVLVVGAGAIGNWVAAYLPQLGVRKIDFLDYDHVEPKNLNRQVQLRGRIHEPKAKVLAERVKHIDALIESKAYIGKITDTLTQQDKTRNIKRITRETILKKNYDAILGCVDNKYARIWLDDFAATHSIPYIDGGTSPKAGQLATFIPHYTKSVDQQLNLQSFPEGTHHCADNLNPSVVMPNMVIGAAMVGELTHIFNTSKVQRLEGPLFYAADIPQRLYVRKGRKRT